MLRRWVAVACVAASTAAAADQATVRLPERLASSLVEGERWGIVLGKEQREDGVLVTLTQVLRPLASLPVWPLPDHTACPDPEALDVDGATRAALLPLFMARPGETAMAVVEGVVRFVSTSVTPDERDTGPQDAVSVLQRRRGRCSGRANAAVGLLRVLGVPARVVHGVLFAASGVRLHRWGEAWLGEAGWVPFDPGASVGAVSVRYLPLDVREADVAAMVLESVEEKGFSNLPVRGGLRLLPVAGVTLHCRAVAPQASVLAVLTGPDGSRWARLGQGGVRFDALIPGLYTLHWLSGDRSVMVATVRLTGTREVSVTLAGPGG